MIATAVNHKRQKAYYHVQFSMLLKQAGDGNGGEDSSSQREVGVNGCPMLTISMVTNGRIKTGPEHPQKQSS